MDGDHLAQRQRACFGRAHYGFPIPVHQYVPTVASEESEYNDHAKSYKMSVLQTGGNKA